MVVVIVDKKEYNLDEKVVSAMKYISEAEVMEKGHLVPILLLRLQSLTSTKKLSNLFVKYSRHLTTLLKNLLKSKVMWLRIILANNLQVLLEKSMLRNSIPCIRQSTIWRSTLSEDALLQLWPAEGTLSLLWKTITQRKNKLIWQRS